MDSLSVGRAGLSRIGFQSTRNVKVAQGEQTGHSGIAFTLKPAACPQGRAVKAGNVANSGHTAEKPSSSNRPQSACGLR